MFFCVFGSVKEIVSFINYVFVKCIFVFVVVEVVYVYIICWVDWGVGCRGRNLNDLDGVFGGCFCCFN